MKSNHLTDVAKVLIIVATIITVCVICAIVFKMTNEGKSTINASTNNFNSMTSQYQDIDVAIYDGSSVAGSEVANFVEKTINSNPYLAVSVKTKANTAGIYYNYSYDDSTKTLTVLTTPTDVTEDRGDVNYINQSAQFAGKTYKDTNGIIICVEFTQQ